MTTSSQADGQPQGQVFDLGYQHYDGPREGRGRARYAVYMDGVRIGLGIGRGGRAKVLPWMFIGIMIGIGLIMALIAGAADRLAGEGAAQELNLPSHSDFYGIASIILFVFAAIVGPELLCPDRRSGAINLYLVRPLTSVDYVISRWAGFLTIMLIVAWLPQIVLMTGLAMGADQPGEYLRDNWLDIPRFLGAGIAIALYTTTLAMAIASYTTRRAYAAAFLVGLFVISTPVTTGLADSLGGTLGEWLSLLNLTNIPMHINDWIFGEASDNLRGLPVQDLPQAVRVGSFFVVTAAAFGIMWNKYRSMTL